MTSHHAWLTHGRPVDRRPRIVVLCAVAATPLLAGAAVAIRHRAEPPTFPDPTVALVVEARSAPADEHANVPEAPPYLAASSRGERLQAEEARALLTTDAAAALVRAREGDVLYPSGAYTAFRKATAVRALVRLKRIEEAQDEARRFLARFPEDLEAEDIAVLTGLAVSQPAPSARSGD